MKPLGASNEDYFRLPEFYESSMPPPPAGADSLDVARRDFISYWSMIYMAFNTSPYYWSLWAQRALNDPQRDPALRSSTHLLYAYNNGGVDVSVSENVGNEMRVVGNMTRFAAALDAYLRIDFNVDRFDPNADASGFDLADPEQRQWPGVP